MPKDSSLSLILLERILYVSLGYHFLDRFSPADSLAVEVKLYGTNRIPSYTDGAKGNRLQNDARTGMTHLTKKFRSTSTWFYTILAMSLVGARQLISNSSPTICSGAK